MNRGGHRLGYAATALGAVAVAALSLTPVIYLFAIGISCLRDPFGVPLPVDHLGTAADRGAHRLGERADRRRSGSAARLLVARTTVVLPRLLTVLFAMPLAVPGFVSSYAAYSAQLVFVPRLDLVTSFSGASVVLALTLYPYVFLPCVVALRTIDPALEEVAASLRPQRLTRLRHVVLPALRPAIAAGVLIVALHVIAEYGAMVQLGRTTPDHQGHGRDAQLWRLPDRPLVVAPARRRVDRGAWRSPGSSRPPAPPSRSRTARTDLRPSPPSDGGGCRSPSHRSLCRSQRWDRPCS